MATRDLNGFIVEYINGIRITHTPEGLIVGEGLESVFVRGEGLKLSDPSNFIRGHYPDNYPFSAPHRHPEEDEYKNFALDPEFPPDGIPLDRLAKVIRELKKMVAGTTSVKTKFPPEVEDGDLVVWSLTEQAYIPATCAESRADVAAGVFFNGVADLETSSVITSSTVTNKNWALEEGVKYYLDCQNPGKLTTEDTGYFVGIGQGPNTLYLAPLADSVEDLITALEEGLAAEREAREGKDDEIAEILRQHEERMDARDASLCTDVKKCITGEASGPGDGGDNDEAFPGIAGDIIVPGGGLVQDPITGKLMVSCQDIGSCISDTVIGMLLEGGGLEAVNGQLVVDFSQMPAEKLRAIVLSMLQQGGGLNVDSNGKIFVDFSQMPTDKFEALIRSLRLPIWLTADMNLYVNQTSGSDTLDSGRGSRSKPFQTPQAAVNYLTDNFNVSRFTCNILLEEQTFVGAVTLGDYQRTSGRATIQTVSDSTQRAKINASNSSIGVIVSNNALWHIDDLEVILQVAMVNASASNAQFRGLHCGSGSSVTVKGLDTSVLATGTLNEDALSGLHVYLRGIHVESESSMTIDISSRFKSGLHVGWDGYTGQENVSPIGMLVYGGTSYLAGSTNASIAEANTQIDVSGSYAAFLQVANRGVLTWQSGYPKNLSFSGSVTGKRYSVNSGGAINLGGHSASSIPGSVEGTVDAASFSYVK